jgi:putative transposase
MRTSRFTEAQIIGMIKEQEAVLPTAELWRKHGLSPATFYKLKAKYGGWTCPMPRCLGNLRTRMRSSSAFWPMRFWIEPLRRHWFKPNGEGGAQGSAWKALTSSHYAPLVRA